jgi:uncharacterized membrane protein YkvA (DUF1232 family)
MTPEKAKWIVILCGLYLLSPIDLLPDAIPVAGQFDDLIGFIVAVLTTRNAARAQGSDVQ